MKNIKFLFYSLLLLSLAACGSSKSIGINQVDDDVYWTSKDNPKSGQSYKDVEKWNKNKGPNPGISQNNYVPPPQNISAGIEDQPIVNTDELRAQEAYQAWQNRKTTTYTGDPDTFRQNNSRTEDDYNDRDARRLGSDRNYYYNDPYYNSLSSNWGWTSFYAPVVRPGFYNWAPGWNIGLSWNNRSGFGVGMGYGMGFGMGYNSPGMYYSPYAYDPFYSPFYSPYSYYGYYNPWYSPYYGYNPWGYYGYGNPYGYHYGYGCGYGYGYGYGYRRTSRSYGNDIVSNRPLLKPRNSMGSSVPGVGSRPQAGGPNGRSMRPDSRPSVDQASGNTGNLPAMSRPGGVEPGTSYRPNRQETGGVTSNRPGGDLINDNNGRPVYVSPNNPSNRPTSSYTNDTRNSNRPGGDLINDNNGKPVYVPPTNPSNRPSSNYNNDTRYSNRPGGELSTGSDGRQVYVPSRPRYTESESNPVRNNTPSQGYDNNSRPGRGESYDNSRPSRIPTFNNGSGNQPSPRNSDAKPSYEARPSYNAPAPRTPSYSPPAQSRPSNSTPSSRPSSSGGSSGSGHSSGGGFRPR